jgi:hypothetical protein
MLSIQDIDNYDLSFINDESSINYIKDMLYALVLTQQYIDNKYHKMWDDTAKNSELDDDIIDIFLEFDGMNIGLNVFDYFDKKYSIYDLNNIFKILCNNMKYYEDHSGFSMSWTFINTKCLLKIGLEEYKQKWISSVN